MASTTPPSNKPTLMTLPAEIRNEIFALVLVVDGSLPIEVRFVNVQNGYRSHPTPPPLAQASQQLREEAMPVFYGLNIFKFKRYQRSSKEIKHKRNNKYSSSPFKWRLGLLNYGIEAPNYVRKLVLTSGNPNFTRENNGDIIITVELPTMSRVNEEHLAVRGIPCICRFEDLVADVARH